MFAPLHADYILIDCNNPNDVSSVIRFVLFLHSTVTLLNTSRLFIFFFDREHNTKAYHICISYAYISPAIKTFQITYAACLVEWIQNLCCFFFEGIEVGLQSQFVNIKCELYDFDSFIKAVQFQCLVT